MKKYKFCNIVKRKLIKFSFSFEQKFEIPVP